MRSVLFSVSMSTADSLSQLVISLTGRWNRVGCDFEEEYAWRLARILHAQGLLVISDIDHVNWDQINPEQYGLGIIDARLIKMIKVDNTQAMILMGNAHKRARTALALPCQNVVIGHTLFDMNQWMSLQLKIDGTSVTDGVPVKGTTEKTYRANINVDTRIGFENKTPTTDAVVAKKDQEWPLERTESDRHEGNQHGCS